ncbi:hypothetical protein [Maribellus sediminis]|uniref:hypothetical protein n=1 Tax=Maribellus sediminis TaxID=2696285 RepID=UPI0014312226|nr:hypothetical protein [Maribellus sediminis]
MDFEQLSKKYRTIKSPDESLATSTNDSVTANSLFEKIEQHNVYSKKQSKQFYIITSIVAIVYVVVFIINPDPDLTLENRLAGSAYILASIILAILFRKKHKKIKNSMYISTPKSFLEEAQKRFRFWNRNQLWLVLVVLLVDVASMFSISKYFDFINNTSALIISQLLYFGLLAFGFFMGKKSWTKKKKPILLKIDEMLAGFDEH